MPSRGKKKYVLEREDVSRVRALELTAQERAVFEWTYTNGSRASESGLAELHHIDLRSGRVQLVHLKGGDKPDWVPMAPRLRLALDAWIKERPTHDDPRRTFIFPALDPGRCYPCRGKGVVMAKLRATPEREAGMRQIKCPHCGGAGTRWGLTRHEASRLLIPIMLRGGIPRSHAYPHVLRHSAVTHLLDAGAAPTAIQERVGHKMLDTTLGYMKTTKAARDLVAKAFGEEGDE